MKPLFFWSHISVLKGVKEVGLPASGPRIGRTTPFCRFPIAVDTGITSVSSDYHSSKQSIEDFDQGSQGSYHYLDAHSIEWPS